MTLIEKKASVFKNDGNLVEEVESSLTKRQKITHLRAIITETNIFQCEPFSASMLRIFGMWEGMSHQLQHFLSQTIPALF